MPKSIAKTGKAKAAKVKPEPHPFERAIGELVSYYDEGWRSGYLEEIEKHTVRIKPIVGYKAASHRCIRIPIGDMKLIERKQNAPST